MARTDPTRVLNVISTTLSTQQVSAFISDASLWVTEELAGAGLSDDRMELIERYLACAMIRIRDLGLKSVTIGDVSEVYQTDLYVSDYLNRAAAFDPTGAVRVAFMSGGSHGKPIKFTTGTGFGAEAPRA